MRNGIVKVVGAALVLAAIGRVEAAPRTANRDAKLHKFSKAKLKTEVAKLKTEILVKIAEIKSKTETAAGADAPPSRRIERWKSAARRPKFTAG